MRFDLKISMGYLFHGRDYWVFKVLRIHSLTEQVFPQPKKVGIEK